MKTAIISGVGPKNGLGARLAHRFGALGLHVFIAGRTQARLDAVAAAIRAADGHATAVVADASQEAAVEALFDAAAAVGPPELAIYNTGNNMPGRILDMEAKYFEESWRVCCLGGFLFGRAALRRMVPHGVGTLLFTGASASLRGRSNFGAFNSAKGALRLLAQAMAKEYGPQGIHVGHVIVDGAIDGDKIHTRFPDYAEKLGPQGLVDLEAIVNAYEFMYRQPPRGWSFEMDVRTASETW
jgi:NAD(P)-dependent dehydrogenase (short-subunit alcohol dehydrogenase family)